MKKSFGCPTTDVVEEKNTLVALLSIPHLQTREQLAHENQLQPAKKKPHQPADQLNHQTNQKKGLPNAALDAN
jgi:hypothetical protein